MTWTWAAWGAALTWLFSPALICPYLFLLLFGKTGTGPLMFTKTMSPSPQSPEIPLKNTNAKKKTESCLLNLPPPSL
jgi:hypothetical protein